MINEPGNFPELKFTSQNCQSLNISIKCKKTSIIVTAICKTGSDIIFLSDIGLNSLIQIAVLYNISKQFNFNGYDFHYNSNFASRGVGIVIKKSLGLNILEIKQDRIGNILLLKVEAPECCPFIIGSIYGPNDINGELFADLSSFLSNLDTGKIVCGGDFNCTWDRSPADANIDTLFMRSIPSLYRTTKIREIADSFNITDPFRFVYPNCRDYTYIPNAAQRNNRSRIDFFMVSTGLLTNITGASIPIGKLSTLFDHKSVELTTGNKNNNIRDPNKVKNSI
jgi:exonuclease III